MALTKVTALRGRRVIALGDAHHVVVLVRWLLDHPENGDVRGISVPPPALEMIRDVVPLGTGGDWEWMATTHQPPARREEEHVLALDAIEDGDAVRALLSDANPGTDARPWQSRTESWVGVRGPDGRLLACGVAEEGAAGVPLLNGITVAPSARGHGLGAAVTARLTRDGVTTTGACTLGVYSRNVVARRVYAGLGYGHVHPWASRVIRR